MDNIDIKKAYNTNINNFRIFVNGLKKRGEHHHNEKIVVNLVVDRIDYNICRYGVNRMLRLFNETFKLDHVTNNIINSYLRLFKDYYECPMYNCNNDHENNFIRKLDKHILIWREVMENIRPSCSIDVIEYNIYLSMKECPTTFIMHNEFHDYLIKNFRYTEKDLHIINKCIKYFTKYNRIVWVY